MFDRNNPVKYKILLKFGTRKFGEELVNFVAIIYDPEHYPLCYGRRYMVTPPGFEPGSAEPKSAVMPISLRGIVAAGEGFEPPRRFRAYLLSRQAP